MASITKTTVSGQERWDVRWSVIENGKRIQKFKRFSSSAEAKAFRSDVENRIRTGTYADSHGMTLGEFLDDWLATDIKNHVRPNTESTYRKDVERIKKYLGFEPLDTLNRIKVQKAFNQMENEIIFPEKTEERNGLKTVVREARFLSPKSIKNVYQVLHTAMHRAQIDGLIVKNPSDDVILPRSKKREHVIPNPDQIETLMDSISQCECAGVIRTCLFTGCRRGEALGLYWSDVNFENSTISFNHAYIGNNLNGSSGELGELKTENGYRVVYMPDVLREELLSLKAEREEMEEEGSFLKSPYVFINHQGKPFEPHSVTQAFTRAAKRAGLEGMHLHDLRHTAITYMLEAGVNPRTVSEIAGHSSPSFTISQYGHVLQNAKKDASDAFMKVAFKK